MNYVNINNNDDITDMPRYLNSEQINHIVSYLPDPITPDNITAELIKNNIKNNIIEKLQNKKVCPSSINTIIEKIIDTHNSSSVIPGTAVGMHAAEGVGRAPIQATMDSFKNAGQSKSASVTVTSIEETLYAKKNRQYEICTLHYKNKYLTYNEVLNTREDIVECTINDFLNQALYRHTDNTYGYIIDNYDNLEKKWWHDEFYITDILNVNIPDKNDIVLRLNLNIEELYKYKVTIDDIVEVLNEQYEDTLNIIYGSMEDAIIDIHPSIKYKITKKKTDDSDGTGKKKKKTEYVVTSYNDDEKITDFIIIQSYINNKLIPDLKKLKLKGVNGIRNLTPIVIPVLSVITNEEKAWMIQNIDSTDEDILILFDLLNIIITFKEKDFIIIKLPEYNEINEYVSKEFYDNMTPITYINAIIKYDIKQNSSSNQKNILLTYNKIKKTLIELVYIVSAHKKRMYKIGIDIDRIIKLYKFLNIKIIKNINSKHTIDLIVKTPNDINSKEYVLNQIANAEQERKPNYEYNELLNIAELVIAEVTGTNLRGLMSLDFLDTNRVTSNNMHVITSVLGIEAAQKFFINDLNQILSNYGLHPQHIMTIAYLFFSKGIPTGAMHNSYNKPYGPIDKASVSKAVDILKSSALQGTTHNITGISTSIVFGLEPKVGTGYFDIAYDTGSQILVNKNIYKIFKQQRNQIDLSNNGITPIDSSNVNNDLNNSLDNYYENTNKLPKILKGKPLTGRKVYPKEEDNPIITDESSEIMKKSVRSTTVKSKYDVI